MGTQKETALLLTHNRKIKRVVRPLIANEWLFDKDERHAAWFALRQLYSVLDIFKGKQGLVIDSRLALPLNPYAEIESKTLESLTDIDSRSDQALEETQRIADKEKPQHIIAWGLVAIVSGLVIIVIILALLVASGRMG